MVDGLRWTSVPGVEKYKVWVKNPDGTPLIGTPVVTYGTGWTPPTALSTGTYSCAVQSVDANGDASALPVSVGWSRFQAPAAGKDSSVTLTGPADGAASAR